MVNFFSLTRVSPENVRNMFSIGTSRVMEKDAQTSDLRDQELTLSLDDPV